MIGALAAALLLTLCCANATPQGRIVVHGAASGSTLRLSVRGSHLVVRGRMSHAHPAGCRFAHGRRMAVCSLRDVGGVEVDMGPNGDFVEVEDKLPVPLTARLGDGSDKFIGNGEPDTCYSEGARRNRCVGGAGDDICITGNQNSDCVGGAGNDYCQTGAGSDGCWGGPGNDVCRMGPGTTAATAKAATTSSSAARAATSSTAAKATTAATACPAGASRTNARRVPALMSI